VSGINRSSVTLTVRNSGGTNILSRTFTANGSTSVRIAPGTYTAILRLDSGNGNNTISLSIVIVGDTTPLVTPTPAPTPTPTSSPPPNQRTAPTIRLIGSNQIVLHLGGSPYFEQGVTATDTVDGNIANKVVTVSNVDITKAGNYTVKYTVTNTAGLSSSVMRYVEIVAPQTQIVPGKTFVFSPKGKQGESVIYSFDVDIPGDVTLTLSSLNKTSIIITILDPAGREVFKDTLNSNTTRNFNATIGNHTARVLITEANGNSSFGLRIATPGGLKQVYPKVEVPR
jgi:PKD repeat protein